ncbi:MAG: TetR family transcriptional regulator [Acidimicrobiales bacterium]
MTVKTRQAAQSAATRAQLLAVGRALFAERGYAGTATEEIVLQAGVTRGALYYHFRNKVDLFRAVFAQMEEDIHQHVSAISMAETEPFAGLIAGCAAFLDACLDEAVQRIVLLDAPAVLGWDAWREGGVQHRFGLLAMGLEWAMKAGQVADQPVAPIAQVLLGALNEGALFIATSTDRRAARDQVAATVKPAPGHRVPPGAGRPARPAGVAHRC